MCHFENVLRYGAIGLAAAFATGCAGQGGGWFARLPAAARQPRTTQPTAVASVFPTGALDALGSSGPRPVILQVRFDVLRAWVPLGEVSKSGKIWNHVDEDVIPADWAAHLRRNGFRVGRGTASSWPPIRAILDAARGTRCQPESLVAGGGPLTLEISARPRDQILFLYRPDGGLVGATFAASTNAIRIEYAVPPTELDSVALSVMPEVHQKNIDSGWKVTPQGVFRNPTEASRILRELAFQAVVPPDHFILIGPSPQIQRQSLAGRVMLVEVIDGQEFESLYFITPRVFRVGGPVPTTQAQAK
jgi:hypothetical protein